MQSHTRDTRFWDRIARRYASHTIKDMAGYERTLARTGQLLHASDTVLEIGCGTGSTALRLAPLVSRLVGTDLSSAMIGIARDKASAQGCTNVEFVAGAAEDAPGLDGAYAAVLAFNVLHLVADRRSALAQALRLLRPGGLFISKTPCLTEMNPLIRLAVPALRLIGKAPHVDFFSAAELEAEVVEAGFAIVERERHGSKPRDPRIFLVARKPEDGQGSDVGSPLR